MGGVLMFEERASIRRWALKCALVFSAQCEAVGENVIGAFRQGDEVGAL